jgi:hypothetical protein
MYSVYGSFVCSLAAEVGLPLMYSCGNSAQAAGTIKIRSKNQLLCGYQREVACCSAYTDIPRAVNTRPHGITPQTYPLHEQVDPAVVMFQGVFREVLGSILGRHT